MRAEAGADQVDRLVEELGRLARRPARLYLVGGATAVLEGWRPMTADVDLRLEPDDELLRHMSDVKQWLNINVELASPADFLPELPGWRERSPFLRRVGVVDVFHYDLYSQALAKLERGFARDLVDVAAMVGSRRVFPARLLELLTAVEPELYRFPAVDPPSLRGAVERLVREAETRPRVAPESFRGLQVDDYDALVATAALADARVELIEGVLVAVPPIGPEHAGTVEEVAGQLRSALPAGWRVREEKPLRLPPASEPEPDIAVVEDRDYRVGHPSWAALVVEVSQSSRATDRYAKSALYAGAGVPEYWVIDLVAREVVVHRDPGEDGYGSVEAVRSGMLESRAEPRLRLDLGRVL